MYLSEIRLYGFKSFPDPINITLNKGITGFVGPNGSGKSNIVDAIRWVLGEQSAKELRATLMEDLIFNGTYKRKPSNLADIVLKFVNEGELELDFSEIELQRKLYRSGESQYLINRKNVRLKDIHKLLLDAGMGVKSYSLFKKSLIEDIVGNKQDALRNLIEESAGISNYKEAKNETIRKIAKAQDKLYRVDDLILEIETQHNELRKQANRAKRYNNYKIILEHLEQFLIRENMKKYSILINEIEQKIVETNEQKEFLNKDIIQIKEKLNKLRNNRKEKEQNLINLSNETQQLSDNIHSLNVQIELDNEKINSLMEKNKLINENKEKLIKEQPIRIERLNSYKKKIEELLRKKKQLEINIENDKNNEIETIYRKEEKAFEKLKNDLKALRNKILIIDANNKNITYKYEHTKNEIKDKQQQIEKEESILNNVKNELEDLNKRYENQKQELEDLNKDKNSIDSIIESIKNDIKKLEEEKNVKEKNITHYNTTIEHLKNRINEIIPNVDEEKVELLRNSINIKKGYESYVKTALSLYINTIIADKNILNKLKDNKGNVSVLFNDYNTKSEHENSLDNFVEAPECVKSFLSHFIVYDNDDILTKESKYYLVSKNNILKTPHGIIVKSGKVIELNFQHKIKQLQYSIAQKEEQLKDIIESIENKKKELKLNEEKREELIKGISTIVSSLDFTQTNIKAYKSRIDAKKNYISKLKEVLKSKISEAERYSEDIDNFIKEREEIEKQIKEREYLAIEEEEKFNKLKENYILFNNQKNETNKILQDLNNEIESINREISSLKESIDNYKDELKDSDSIIEQNNNSIEKLKDNIEQNKIKYNELKELFNKYNENIDEINKQLQEFDSQIESLINSEEEKTVEYNKLNQKLNEFAIEKQKYETQNEMGKEKYEEDFEIDYELIEKYKDNAADNIILLKDKMIRMEPINQRAFQEYEEITERLEDMRKQKQDILLAKENLEKTIKNLDAKAKVVFVQYFETIRDNFKQLFMDIFVKGHADIILLEEDKPLESEIQIVFEPKDKKVNKLVMLSDGERAMMVICLLFAMYMVRPTPVCIMDEIDGPLDDANVENFVKLLQRFREKTQFILITHNKRTMEFCDYLFGVTMEESGVTTIVSLNLQSISEKFLENA